MSANHPSVPPGTPAALFQSERWDPAGAPELQWDFPVTPGQYQVRLYFAEIYAGAQVGGARVFDVAIEGQTVLNDYDVYAEVGGFTGVVKSFTVTADANLDIDFGHVVENPAVKGIEVLAAGAGPSTGAWSPRAAAGLSRQEVAYVHAGGKLYLAGGSNAHQAYDPASGTWAPRAPLPQSLDHIQGVEVGGRIFYIGGLVGFPGPSVGTVHIYDPATDSFTQGSPMPSGRGRGAGGVASHGGRIYYSGGLSNGTVVPWFDVYDPVADTWAQLPDMPRARDHFHAAAVNGRFYVTGGRAKEINATITATDAFDFGTAVWVTGLAPLPTARGGFAAAVLGRELIVIGGEGGGRTFSTVEAYDTSTNNWRALAPMPTARHGIQAATCNGGVYIAAGGTTEGGSNPSSVQEVFFLDGARPCAPAPPPSFPTYRVNAGGPELSGSPPWSGDASPSPSPFSNQAAAGNATFSTTTAVDTTHPSVPAGAPAAMFQSERWDFAGAPELTWAFPVEPASYEVRLYFAEIFAGTQAPGARVFDVAIEGGVVLDDYDTFADVGGYRGVMKAFVVSADATLTIELRHVKDNPAIKGIEIVPAAQPDRLGVSPSSIDAGSVAVGSSASASLVLVNQGGPGDPVITVSSTTLTGPDASQFADSFADGSAVTVGPGESVALTVRFSPTTTGAKTASLSIAHSGANSPVAVGLAGMGAGAVPGGIGFAKGVLAGSNSANVTSVQFGPDGRLYAGQQDGLIKAYTVARDGVGAYRVTATETIGVVRTIPNHDDNGTPNPSITDRLLTGILVTGTATDPVIYASSSDPRIGGGPGGTDYGTDTNSGAVSRLTRVAGTWQRADLVRGLPRSIESHGPNGLQIDLATNSLFVAQGGQTNKGATSANFAFLPEYALSAAILRIDLAAIASSTYDIPTLDDDSRPGLVDTNDPFGGNEGKNQARLVAGGPVQVHMAGFRNAYDLVLTASGRMYTIDNGGNAGWGSFALPEGPQGACTNQVNEAGTTDQDDLQLVIAGGYGGHPNPTRANKANTFNTGPAQSPVATANPVECDYRSPGPERGSLALFPASTNGLAEYRASNFGGAMAGDLLAAGFNNVVYRVKLNSTGTAALLTEPLFSTVDVVPLDVATQPDGGVFPGTIWVGDIATGRITVFEPNDFGGGGGPSCSGASSSTLDEDGDGFTNADEIDNTTNPCSAADVPPDADGDKVSDRNDPDDDNDGAPDTSDPFALDPANGTATNLGVRRSFNSDGSNPGGLLNLGFTGLMTNGVSDYLSLFDPAQMTAGGAAGVVTVDAVPAGDPLGSSNSQQYGFQFGAAVPGERFVAHTRVMAPFAGLTPQGSQSMGLFIGTGDQDNYAKLVVSAQGGGGVQFLREVAGSAVTRPLAPVPLPG
ncbi:MAG: malectin domain-containing carbohydrate-binding protein, partial [Acidimicrobiales bacterium]